MDSQDGDADAAATPEWRPLSSMSGGSLSTPSSSFVLSPHQVAVRISQASSGSMDAVARRDIEPYEASICERLTQEIICCDVSGGTSIKSPSSTTSSSLAKLLQEVALTIQFHSKWFAPAALATLVQAAIDSASRSSSTTDLYAALKLIDTIGTYALIPAILPPVRFIAYSYYQGSRSNRHKRLNQHAWTVAEHILESHLGGQFAGALLEIISDLRTSQTTFTFAATIGALMITTHKMLPQQDSSLPTMQPIQLLLSLKASAVGSNPVLREQVAIMLGSMLRDDAITKSIELDGGLGVCLDLAKSCVTHHLDKYATETLYAGLELRLAGFEIRHEPRLAQLFVEARRPLPTSIADQLLLPWQRSILLNELESWESDYAKLLRQLSDSSQYLPELQEFIGISVTAYFQTENLATRRAFVDALHILIQDAETATPAVEALAKGLVRIFTHKTIKEKWEAQRNWLFPILCSSAKHSVEITQLLLSIRADAGKQGYLDTRTPPKSEQLIGLHSRAGDLYGLESLSLDSLVDCIHRMLVREPRWEVYQVLLTSLPSLIRNHALWGDHYQQVTLLRQAICDQLNSDSFVEPPSETGLGKSYVICQLIQILTATISYHSQLPRSDIKAAVITIINVAGSRDHTVSVNCVHALSISCYELPDVMAGFMDAIIHKMTRMVTQRNLALYVLEFFAGLSRFSRLQNLLRREDYKRIFGVCHSYLQSVRNVSNLERKRTPTSETSAGMSSTSNDDMAQYVYALAHHVITFWYMALRREDRHGLKEYITSCLRYTDSAGEEHIEDQGLVTIDLMDRVDADEDFNEPPVDQFNPSDGRTVICHRITGMLLIATETALRTGKTIVTIRRPSGTTQRLLSTRLEHDSGSHDDLETRFTASVTVESDSKDYIAVFPEDVAGRTYGKIAVPRPSSALGSLEIITLPESDEVNRAIQFFDLTSALDSHKAGVIFVGEDQTREDQILLNTSGTPDYRELLEDLGSLRKLRGATFNTQGLDRRNDEDGEYSIVWNNDVTELVYHITTFMPNYPNDEHMAVINKKRHIGNDFVNIVFNNSGRGFDFNTFPSAFNYVYIVISPSQRTSFLQARHITSMQRKKDRFYNVHCMTRPGYPNLSSASEVKVISGASLGGYVRNLALNACVFALMWQAGEGDYPSSWRQRLQAIRRLHGQYKAKVASGQ